MSAAFLNGNAEDGDFNQYWYSARTIEVIVDEISELNGKVCFLSTPSLYFSLPENIKNNSFVFDVRLL